MKSPWKSLYQNNEKNTRKSGYPFELGLTFSKVRYIPGLQSGLYETNNNTSVTHHSGNHRNNIKTCSHYLINNVHADCEAISRTQKIY